MPELKGSKTEQNLMAAFAGESQARNKYTYYASQAKEEGFETLAVLFEMVGRIEKEHEERYRTLLEAVKNNTVFEKNEKVVWECSNCGHVFEGDKAPQLCPVCKHPQAYFFMKAKNY